MTLWYQQLVKPPLTPPDWLFAPVWTVLYIMIAVSIILFFTTRAKKRFWLGTAATLVNLTANFLWAPLFFGLQNIPLSVVDILVLDMSLVVMVHVYWQNRRWASMLLWPYLIWGLFASYLNIAMWVLNGFHKP